MAYYKTFAQKIRWFGWKLPLQPAKSKLWLLAHFWPFYPNCKINNYNQLNVAIYYGGYGGVVGGGDGVGGGGGGGSAGGATAGGGGGRVMVVA